MNRENLYPLSVDFSATKSRLQCCSCSLMVSGVVPGTGLSVSIRAVYMKKNLTSKRRTPEAFGQVSLQTHKGSQYKVLDPTMNSVSLGQVLRQGNTQLPHGLQRKLTSSHHLSSSVPRCCLCVAVLEQGNIHGFMNTPLCSPSRESELTHR